VIDFHEAKRSVYRSVLAIVRGTRKFFLREDSMRGCGNCGTNLSPGMKFCWGCGESVGESLVQEATGSGRAFGLTVESFRLPEERFVLQAMPMLPGTRKLQCIFPRLFETEPLPDVVQILTRKGFIRLGVFPKHQTVKEAFDEAFQMFGRSDEPFEVFIGREYACENALCGHDGERPVFQFLDGILGLMNDGEVRSIVGHEVGHFLLGHVFNPHLWPFFVLYDAAKRGELPRPVFENLVSDPDIGYAFTFAHCLSQLQELSADRIGLLLSGNLQTAASAFLKLEIGYDPKGIDLASYLRDHFVPAAPEDWALRHPDAAKRCMMLSHFEQSELFRSAIGCPGGKPAEAMSEFLRQVVLIPAPPPVRPEPDYDPAFGFGFDDRLILLFCMERVAQADDSVSPSERSIIDRAIPKGLRELAPAQLTALQKEAGDGKDASDVLFDIASAKSPRWKSGLLRKLANVVKADRKIKEDELTVLCEIADRIGARKQCEKVAEDCFGLQVHWKN
jgi:uncharacterized tellurite resistance protein B-like protein